MKVVEMVDITSKCDIESLNVPLEIKRKNAHSDLSQEREGFSSLLKLARPLSIPGSLVSPSKRQGPGKRIARGGVDRCKAQTRAKARIVEFRSSGHLSPDPERENGHSARIDHSLSTSSGYLARILTPPDSALSPKFDNPITAEKTPYPLCAGKQGEILFVTEDISMVYTLRSSIVRDSIGVTWTNNFWIAMSYLHDHSFDSVVVDLAAASVEERFLLQFIEEYEVRSRGKKIFFSNKATSSTLIRQLEKRGHCVLDEFHSCEDLVGALAIKKR